MTRSYRAQLARRRNALVADILDIWPGFDADAIRTTWPATMVSTTALIQRHGALVAADSARYYALMRIAAGIDDDYDALALDGVNIDRVATSLEITGAQRAWRAVGRGASSDVIAKVALAGVIGSASRLVLDQGRQTVAGNAKRDDRARGWERVASANACDFCSGLAGIPSGADEAFEAHDNCGCSAAPAFG